MFFKLNLPPSIHVKAITYGKPRVGNQAWAALFDSQVSDFTRINNERDPIPTMPERLVGFQHPKGEVHIVKPGEAYSCPGDEDATDSQCTILQVPIVVLGNVLDHFGPYEGIPIGPAFCT